MLHIARIVFVIVLSS